MSNTDTELFELCKQVYKATGWGRTDNGSPTDEYYAANPVSILLNKRDFIKGWQIRRWEDFGESGRLNFSLGKGKAYPLYTSDYLLDKLPKHLESQEKLNVTYFDEVPETGEICWRAEYTHLFADGTWDIRWEYQGNGDTPLKALLKLTLKLHEEGLL